MSTRGICFRCVAYESHRCRNEKMCPDGLHFEEYIGSTVKQCLCATVEVYQDGYIHCPIIDSIGCEECVDRFGDGSNFYYDESQNYQREPRWREEVREVAKKKAVEQKSCPHLKESSGPAMPSMYIVCECGRIDFKIEEEFYRQFEICNHKPKECGLQLLHKEVTQLDERLKHWEHLKEFGGQDPFNADGCNMYLTRNHIIYHKNEIEKICSENSLALPEIYHTETPPEVDMNYMARADEIRSNARKSLETYKADENYQYLLSTVDKLNKREKDQTCISNVIGYATGLEQYIEVDKLVDMRRHEASDRYQESFRECAEKVRAILVEQDSKAVTTKKRQCGSCNYGHWYSGYNTYVSVVSDDGRTTTKRPCEPRTHYCYQFDEGQKKIAADKDFNPEASPEWCPLRKLEESTCEKSQMNTGSGSCASGSAEDIVTSIVDKPAATIAGDLSDMSQRTCKNCTRGEDWGESVEYIKCAESGRRRDVRKKQPACANYVPDAESVMDDEPEEDLEEQLDELLNEEAQEEQTYVYRGLV